MNTENENFDVSIFIINEDNEYISNEEYVRKFDGECVFVMLTNDELNDYENNEICIYKYWNDTLQNIENIPCTLESSNIQTLDLYGQNPFKEYRIVENLIHCYWQSEYIHIPNIKTHEYNIFQNYKETRKLLNGYQQTIDIINVLRYKQDINQYIPAIMLAYNTLASFNNRRIHGYLPAPGQLLYIFRNKSKINLALSKTLKYKKDIIHFKNYIIHPEFPTRETGCYCWSSFIYNDNYVIGVNNSYSSNRSDVGCVPKRFQGMVMPIFKI